MEIAIPLLALGGMYIISNKNTADENAKKNMRKENYANMGMRTNLATKQSQSFDNYLPNVNTPALNYPVESAVDTVENYPTQNSATDSYLNQNLYQEKERKGMDVGNNMQSVYSLTGERMEPDHFKHNNMVPFNGGKVKGRSYEVNIAETVLDNMAGNGSQLMKKVEQAPLFKPQENMQWSYGMPNQSDFYQSRVNSSLKNNNIKPFESEQVGPGLNHGYNSNGSGGFNSGMEARDKWMPKTVDQLRVDTNPKLEYELSGHEGPADSFIKNAPTTQLLGRVEKQRPDTYFINSQDRWLTTTGASKGETLRSIQETGIIRRNDVPVDYMGPAGAIDVKATTAPQNFEPAKRHEALGGGINHSMAVGRGNHNDKDLLMKSHTNYENNRSTVKQPETIRSGFGGAIGAVIAPIMDIFRPTRKDETINNIRVFGDIGTSGMNKGPVYNMNDTAPTTIKETTLFSQSFNINNQKEGIYINNHSSPDMTQRDTTSSEYFTSAGGYATGYGNMNYESAYRQHNNDIKSQTIMNRPNQGGTQMFNNQMNMQLKDDNDRLSNRVNPAYSKQSVLPPSTQTFGTIRRPQFYDETAGQDRINPDILSAFKSNPYVHSLSSVA